MNGGRRRSLVTRVLVALLVAWTPAWVGATTHVLLIGVSDYPNLPKRLWLQGPRNDVALMRSVLIGRGIEPARIRQLTSGAGGADEPTRSNIVAAMQATKDAAQPGDQVILYFAGHGSQQPQPADHGTRPTEPDGLDEVFLPADVTRWSGETSVAAIPNAILDDEIGEWIDATVDRGAVVWAVFDTCHAAGMARAPVRGAVRSVSLADLGLPLGWEAAMRGAVTRPASPQPARGREDGRALLFAASTHESATEEWQPLSAPMTVAQRNGVFTFHLANALSSLRKASLGDIEQAVRRAYARERRIAPTPRFLGDVSLRLR